MTISTIANLVVIGVALGAAPVLVSARDGGNDAVPLPGQPQEIDELAMRDLRQMDQGGLPLLTTARRSVDGDAATTGSTRRWTPPAVNRTAQAIFWTRPPWFR